MDLRPPRERRRGSWLPLTLSEHSDRTLRASLRDALKDAIRSGRLTAGSVLPSTRALAADLGVSRGVVVDAYAHLGEEGFLVSRGGSGTMVSDAAQPATRRAQPERAVDRTYEIDLRPGPPDLATFPRAAWLTATREVLRSLPDAELGYASPWGVAALRDELAEHLTRVRAAMASPESCLVVNGATQGLTLLVRTLAENGHKTLAVESPSHSVQRRILGRHGLRVVDVPIDEQGIDVDALARTGCRAVLVTPAHQYPTGIVLSATRRNALIRWAERVGGIIIEDDYNPEFRYDRRPVGCLQGFGPEYVVLVGSVSKTLAPGLRLGWLVSPPQLHEALSMAKRDDDFGTGVLGQHVLAELFANGGYDRHVRRVRRHYMQRRDVLVSAMAAELPTWQVSGQAGGLHVMLRLPPGVDEDRIIAAAAAKGLALQGTRAMYGSLPAEDGVIVSYARAPRSVLADAVRRLADAAHLVDTTAPPPDAESLRVVAPAATALDYF